MPHADRSPARSLVGTLVKRAKVRFFSPRLGAEARLALLGLREPPPVELAGWPTIVERRPATDR